MFMSDFNDKFNDLNNTTDTTSEFDPADIQSNKFMAILSYISWLVLVPLLAAKNSPFARFHANQGIVLAIIDFAVGIALKILTAFPIVGIIFSIIGTIWAIARFVLMIIGILNACNGKAKELPLLGSIKILK